MILAFYRPSPSRCKIVIEKNAFPSDYHAVISQIQLHGLDVSQTLVEVSSKEGQLTLEEDDIEALLLE